MVDILCGNVVWKFGDNFNADLIVGSKYIGERDPGVLAMVCMSEIDPSFPELIRKGDIIIAGKNFGYGHPHYQGIVALQSVGISALVAESFYPLWYRIAVFYAFPVIECENISTKAEIGERLKIDFGRGIIWNFVSKEEFNGKPMPPMLIEIIRSGGLVAYLHGKTP